MAITLTYTLAAVLTVGAPVLGAQQAALNQSGFTPVTVTDPLNRFVTGLEKENFVVLENSAPRPVTYFSNVDSPIAFAIVSQSPVQVRDLLKPDDELIQTTSLTDALSQLVASKNQRKVMIVTTSADVHGVPAGIQVIQSEPAIVSKWVVELRNQYLLRFQVSDPAARVEITLKQPRGLPVLKPVWAAPY